MTLSIPLRVANLLRSTAVRSAVLCGVAIVSLSAGTDYAEQSAPADLYGPWSQGRPAESLDLLLGRAKATDRWDAWYDAGLAAAAAGDKGQAVSCLVAAHVRNPAAAAPRDALRALDVPLPVTWVERAGPFGVPGSGWAGVVLFAVAGGLIGYGAIRWQRKGVFIAGAGVALLAAPGVFAALSDAEVPWAAVVHDTQALDSTGAPLRALPAGTLVRQEQAEPWAGRTVVRLLDGQIVMVAQGDAEKK